MHSIHTNRFGAPKVEYLEPEMSDKRLAYCVSTPNKPAQVGVLYLGGKALLLELDATTDCPTA